MKMKLVSVAALAACLMVPLAVQAEDKAPEKGKGGGFAAADTNGDKKLSEEEFVAFFGKRLGEEKAHKRFAAGDTDGDGFLVRKEFRVMMEKQMAHRKGAKKDKKKSSENDDSTSQ